MMFNFDFTSVRRWLRLSSLSAVVVFSTVNSRYVVAGQDWIAENFQSDIEEACNIKFSYSENPENLKGEMEEVFQQVLAGLYDRLLTGLKVKEDNLYVQDLEPLIVADADKIAGLFIKGIEEGVENLRKDLTKLPSFRNRFSNPEIFREAIFQSVNSKMKLQGIDRLLQHFNGILPSLHPLQKDYLCNLKARYEAGTLFSRDFIKRFSDVFFRSYFYKIFKKSFDMNTFFGEHVPLSDAEMFYGVIVFQFFQRSKSFESMETDRLLSIEKRIKEILQKRQMLLCMSLCRTSACEKNDVRCFFSQMTEKLEGVQDKIRSLLDERCYRDPEYWEPKLCIDEEEGKKILGEIE